MKTILKYLIILCSPCLLFSQSKMPTEAINGTYHLLEGERGVGNKPTKTKLFQYALWGKTKVLAVAACGKCMPAIYKYKENKSKELGKPFFYNDMGISVITYDSESFVMIMPVNKKSPDWNNLAFSNFYSKDIGKVNTMSKEKIKEYILKVLK